ncbi:MAG: SUMF1/EgtB/PvdO family nonheme iron enzyme, partial [bacterium]|nr:SUMF1/EgtB/PvdO family nonheme iron enzyme [bacterium]
TFNSSTYPNSNSYSGAATAVEVVNISTAQSMTADLLVGIISNLDVDEIEPNNVWDDVGVITIPAPNSDPDGKLNYTDDLSDFWSVQVSQPSIIDAQVDSYQDTVNLNLTLWGPSGSGPIEVSSTTQSDEHLRACAALPGTYYVEVSMFQMAGLNIPVDPYTVIFAVIDIADTGGGGNIGLSVESYKDIDFSNGMVIYPNFPLASGIANAITAPMPLSYVAAGDFWMGSDPPNDPYYNPACDLNEETPAHWNRTGNYYIGRYEITNADYKQFMDDGGYETESWWAAGGWTWKNDNGLTQPEYWNDPDYRIGDAWGAYPVAGLSWYECMAYSNYVGGRLPRETEWEKAGRGTDGRIYTYGNVYNPSICALGYYPDPVGSHPASDSVYGLTDMCGNIFEWTYTSWAWGMYERYSEGILDEPGSYSYKMQRGYRYLVVGDCDQDYATRLSYRDTWPRTYRWSITGLRVAFDEP